MNDHSSGGFGAQIESLEKEIAEEAFVKLGDLLQGDRLIGDVFKIDYGECDVLVHDYARQKVGGLPLGSFLLASRLSPGEKAEPTSEEASILLLRVTGQARLPNAAETDQFRFLAGQRVADNEDHWDSTGKTDQFTLHQLRYAGARCRVIGTFRLKSVKSGSWAISFGADISNFYSGRGLKVYKPNGEALKTIVNFPKEALGDEHPLAGVRVPVGRVRYASSEIDGDPLNERASVEIDPTDLIARRTALFGMSRTGKSNTTKVIASSVFTLRNSDSTKGRVGQLILDVNGEYANENVQDGGSENPSCLKNVAKHSAGAKADDISTYGLAPHPADPDRKLVKLNFYGSDPSSWTNYDEVCEALEPLLQGKLIIDEHLRANETAKYQKAFMETSLEPPESISDFPIKTRYHRAIILYRAVLSKAGFKQPSGKVWIKGLFGKDLQAALEKSASDDAATHAYTAKLMGEDSVTWSELVSLAEGLSSAIRDKESGYHQFNQGRAQKGKEPWDDPRLLGILGMFEWQGGTRSIYAMREQHDPSTSGDYAENIVADLQAGRLVIFDQSIGDPIQNKMAAERIMRAVFAAQRQAFVHPKTGDDGAILPPPDVLIYVEEAHNLLPAGTQSDTSNIWSRVAKEGSKYRIGLVYATQEPSSIQSNILKNTDNWFVAHLNSSDETKEIRKFYDFTDFEGQILRVPDAGFLRMRTLSNPYIVPIQVNRFKVSDAVS